MLVLTRKAGEWIKVGDDVEIRVVEVRGEQVRIGIRAPGDMAITRGELPGRAEAGPPEETEG